MPTLTRWYLRAAIVNLVVGLGLGLILAVPSLAELGPGWRPVYVHLLVMGWATQMIFGVAYWMFPRRQPLDLTVVDWVGWISFACFNAGLLLRAIAEPRMAAAPTSADAGALALSAALQLIAILGFVIQAWPRVTAK